MKILTTESFKQIKPLLQENYSNIHARLALKLSADTADMFSKFTLQPSNGGGQWSVNIEEENNLRPMSEASEIEQDQISIALKRASAEVRQAFPSIADKLMTVPDADCIFFYRRAGRIQVILTAWGFQRTKTSQGTPVIRLCLERAETLTDNEVDIKISYSDGTPAADKQFRLHIFNNIIPITTDRQGIFHAGHIRAGKQFSIEYFDGFRSNAITIEKDRSLYEVILEKTTSLTIHVEHANKTSAHNISTLYNDRQEHTDANGNAVYGPYLFTGEHQVSVTVNGDIVVSHILKENPEENIINVTLPPERKIILDPWPPHVSIKIVDKHGIPQCSMPVKVLCQKGYEETFTDENGVITILQSELVPGEKPKIILKRPKTSKKNKQKIQSPATTPPANSPSSPSATRNINSDNHSQTPTEQ